MKQILTLFAICFALCLSAQTVQKGIVKEYNEKAQKTPLAGVELDIRNTNSTVSDKSGNFQLEFLTLKPGEHVNVRGIEKLGYEIFNKEAIEQWNINPNTPFVVIMCRSDRFKKIRDNYEKVASASYARQLEKEKAEIAKLKKEGILKETEYNQKLIEIQDNYYRQLDNLDNYIDRIARIDLSELSVSEQKIIDLVQTGNLDEAIRLYDELNIPLRLAEQIQNKNTAMGTMSKLEDLVNIQQESIDSLYAMADRQIDILKFQGLPENINKIISIYNDIAQEDPTNISWHLKAGLYIAAYTADYELARSYYKKALDQASKQYGDSHHLVATAYNNIASTFHYQGNLKEALRNYETALNMRLKIFGQSHPEVASSYNNIGMILSDLGDHKSALEAYNTALDIRKQYFEDPHPLIAQSYNNIGSAYHYLGDFGNALKYGLIALEKEKLLLNERHPSIATSYNNIGAAYMDCGELDKAIEFVSKGLEMRDLIFGKNHIEVANSYNTMGLIYFRKNDFHNAEEYFSKALEIRRNLLGDHHILVAQSYNNVASSYANLGKMEKALEYYRIVLSIYEKALGSNHPKTVSAKSSLQNIENSHQR